MTVHRRAFTIAAAFALTLFSATSGFAQSEKKLGYVIAEVSLIDPAAFSTLRARVKPTLEPFHGRLAVRGKPEMRGGVPSDLVIVWEFDSVADAKAWYGSPAYQAIIPDRDKAAKVRVMIVEGLAP